MSFRRRLGFAFAVVLALAVPAIVAGFWGLRLAISRQDRLHAVHEESRDHFANLLRLEEVFAVDGEAQHTREVSAQLAGIRVEAAKLAAQGVRDDALLATVAAYEEGYAVFAQHTVNLRTLQAELLRISRRAHDEAVACQACTEPLLALHIATRDLFLARGGHQAAAAVARAACERALAAAGGELADARGEQRLARHRVVARLTATREALVRYDEERDRQEAAQAGLRGTSLAMQEALAAACRAERVALQVWTDRLKGALLATACAAILAGLLATMLLSARIAAPLRLLTQSVDRLMGGQARPAPPVPLASPDEFGDLARAFNEMAGRLRATGRMAKVGTWELDPATGRQRWTEEVYRIHEVDDDFAPTAEAGVAFYDGESRPVIEAAVRGALERGEPFDLELRIVTAKGRRRWVHAIGEAERRDGRVARVFGTFQDITERREAQEDLFRAQQVVEHIQIGLYLYHLEDPDDDRTLRMVYANPAAAAITGVAVRDVVGRTLDENFPGLRAQGIPQRYAVVARSGVPQEFEDVHYGDDRVLRAAFSVKVVPLPGRQLAVAFEDISVRLKAQQEARDQAARAEQAARAKSVFLANVSHDVRTPLHGILGTLEAMDPAGLSQRQREDLAVVRASAQGVLGILNDVLDLSAIESGVQPLRMESFRMAGILEDTARIFGPEAAATGMVVAFGPPASCAGCPDWFFGDATKIRRVLVNLVGNALKHAGRGRVELACSCGPAGGPEAREVHLRVRDEGPGIPPAEQQRVFEPFQRAGDGSRPGLGLGLSIARRLVELMGGRIWLESEPGRGCTFHVVLVLAPAGRPAAAPPAATAPPAARRVLLAEDHPVNRKIATAVLDRLGCTVDCAEDGVQAVSAALAADYDVVLMDIQMPRMDGVEAMLRIRAARPGLRIIAVTANAFEQDRAEYLRLGFSSFLPKPFTADQLAAELRTS